MAAQEEVLVKVFPVVEAVMVAAAVVMSAAVAVVLPFSVYLVRGFGLGLRRRRNSHSPGVC